MEEVRVAYLFDVSCRKYCVMNGGGHRGVAIFLEYVVVAWLFETGGGRCQFYKSRTNQTQARR